MNNQGVKSIVILAALAAAIFLPVGAGAQSNFADTHITRYISDSDGLPCNFIDDILEDESGFLWVATSGGGLCRYDGYEFITFSTNSANSLKSNFVRNIAPDRHNRLWVGSEGGVDVIDLQTLESCMDGIPELEKFQYSFCSYLASDALGRLWVNSGTDLYRIEFAEDGSVTSVLTFSDPRLSPVNLVFKDVESDGSVWVCLSGSFYKISEASPGTLSARLLSSEFSIRPDAYLSDFLPRENEIWISTNDGLYRLSRDMTAWRLYSYSPSVSGSVSQDFISSLAVTSGKTLLAASLKGINVYDSIGDSFSHILENEFVNCLYVSGDCVWVGTESSGLVKISPRRINAVNYSNDPSDPSSISPNPVNTILEDGRGRIWAGNVETGLNCFTPSTGTFIHYTHANSGLSHNSVSALALDPSGMLWVGTWGGGVDVVDISKDFRIVKQFVPQGVTSGPLNYVGLLAMDSANNIMWIGTNAGLFCYDISADRLFPALDSQSSGCVGACIDSSGRLWTGGQLGLYLIDLNTRDTGKKTEQFPYVNYRYKLDNPSSRTVEKISCVMQASDGTIWLGGIGSGLYKAEETASGAFEFRNFGVADGLSNDRLKGIEEDGSGRLWISTDRGLYLFDPLTESFSSFGEEDGLHSSRYYWNASCRLSDGRLCFGQVGGLTIIDPSRTAEQRFEPNLKFTGITVGDRVIRDPSPEVLRLHERDRFISIEFAALVFEPGESVSYRYRLGGFDDSWVAVPYGRNYLSLSSLPHGSYMLDIESFDEAGQNVGAASLPIRVAPRFYNTVWFYILLIAVGLLSVFFFIRRRERNLRRNQALLQATVEERTEELSAQKKLLEQKAEELAGQNRLLALQNEELASRKILYGPDIKTDVPDGEKFLGKLMEAVRANYKDSALDVPTLCSLMGMSKTLLNTRMQEVVGQSAGQFIRTYRLTVAKEMLSYNNSMNVSEIAYEVGFNDPKYFTRCFTKEFGVAPSSLLK